MHKTLCWYIYILAILFIHLHIHILAYDGPDDTREYFTAVLTTRDLFDTYLPSTEAQVMGAQVAQLMPAYTSLQAPGEFFMFINYGGLSG